MILNFYSLFRDNLQYLWWYIWKHGPNDPNPPYRPTFMGFFQRYWQIWSTNRVVEFEGITVARVSREMDKLAVPANSMRWDDSLASKAYRLSLYFSSRLHKIRRSVI
jgi:hypothetical protein